MAPPSGARGVDAALIEEWQPWIGRALTQYASAGYGSAARTMTLEELRAAAASPDLLHSAAIDRGADGRGLVVVTHSRWEESAVGRPFAKIALLAADSHALTLELARGALLAAMEAGVVLISFRAGNAPTHVHVALADAGMHVGSESLHWRADIDAIAAKVARVPLRGVFRPATADDADAVADIARRSFVQARYTADPHFPAEWGARIYEEWARQLVNGAADVVIVAEEGSRVIGFVSVSIDYASRPPGLLAVEPRYDGSGLGVMLVRAYLDWFRERGVKAYEPRTEKNNVGINALYRSLGFEILDAEITYHASPALRPPPPRERLRSL